jgi:ABC-2 type transport system ATP-binding protein
MRRRLDIAMSLVARPAVLVLDEPTTGLDPRSRLAMWDLIDQLVADGTTTLLTTQYLEEAERLADRVVVVDRGAIIADGTVDELKVAVGGDRLAVTVARAADLEPAVALLQRERLATPGTAQIDRAALTATVAVADTRVLVPGVVRLFDHAGIVLHDVAVRRPTLDDVFLQLTGHVASPDDLQAHEGPGAPVPAAAGQLATDPAAVTATAPDPPDEADEILRLLGEHARSRGGRARTEADLELALRQLDARWSPQRRAGSRR